MPPLIPRPHVSARPVHLSNVDWASTLAKYRARAGERETWAGDVQGVCGERVSYLRGRRRRFQAVLVVAMVMCKPPTFTPAPTPLLPARSGHASSHDLLSTPTRVPFAIAGPCERCLKFFPCVFN